MKIILITGTKGKTTVLVVLDFILRNMGKKTFCINSEGVFKNGKLIKDNAYFLKKYETSANVVAIKELSKDDIKGIDYVLLECSYSNAKNLKKSLLGNKVDIGVLTNVYVDHIDGNRVKDRNDLLRHKVEVMKNIKKGGIALVFAGDKRSNIAYRATDILKNERPDIEVFNYARSKKSNNREIVYYLKKNFIEKNGEKLLDYNKVNLAFKYLHKPTDANFVLLVAILDLLGIDQRNIVSLKSINNLVPGRLNFFSCNSRIVILDYAHETQSLKAASILLRKKYKNKKIIAVVRFSYYRNSKTIKKLTSQLGAFFDSFIVYDKAVSRPELKEIFLRKFGFKVGEVAEIMVSVLRKKGFPVVKIENEMDAIENSIKKLRKNEIVYIMGDQIKKDILLIRRVLSS